LMEEKDILESGRQEKPQKKSQKKRVGLAIILLLLLLAGVAGWRFWSLNQKRGYDADSEAVKGMLSGRTPEEIQALLDQVVEKGMFNVSINGQITVGADKKGNVRIENIQNNHYLMQVDIIQQEENGTQTVLYSSGIIAPGYSIENGTFKTLPPKGPVDGVAVFTALDQNTQEKVGQTNVAVILTGEN